MVNFFPPNTWQIMTFLNPLDALIPKAPFSLLPRFGSGSPPGPRGQSRQDFGGALIDPPPPPPRKRKPAHPLCAPRTRVCCLLQRTHRQVHAPATSAPPAAIGRWAAAGRATTATQTTMAQTAWTSAPCASTADAIGGSWAAGPASAISPPTGSAAIRSALADLTTPAVGTGPATTVPWV